MTDQTPPMRGSCDGDGATEAELEAVEAMPPDYGADERARDLRNGVGWSDDYKRPLPEPGTDEWGDLL